MSSTRTKARPGFPLVSAAIAAALALALALVPASARAAVAGDDFDRPDGPLGASWSTVAGSTSISAGRATGSDHSAAMLVGASGSRVTADAYASPGRLSFVALLAGYSSTASAYFFKVQDNNGDGAFDTVFAYNGLTTGGQMLGSWAVPATSHARISLSMAGQVGTFAVDGDLDGDPDQTFSVTFPTAVPAGAGLGFYGGATADDFAVDAIPVTLGVPATSTVTAGSGSLAITADAGGLPAPGGVEVTISGQSTQNLALVNGVADVDLSGLPVGTYTVTVRYPFTMGYEPALASGSLTVEAIPTATALTSSAPSVAVGGTVQLEATVSAAAGTTSGNVSFFDGATLLGTSPLSGSKATFAFGSAVLGAHTLTAVYEGAGPHAASSSDALVVMVDPASTTTTLSLGVDETLVDAQVTATATVTAAGTAVTGDVEFSDGATVLGTAPLTSGAATFPLVPDTVGTHTITARYLGEAGTSASIATPVTLEVTGHPATVALTTGALREGTPATLRAIVSSSPVSPTGTVEFFANGVSIGSAPLVGGTAELAGVALSPGDLELRAAYSGSAKVAAADAVIRVEVARVPLLGATGADLGLLGVAALLLILGAGMLPAYRARSRREA